MKQQSSSAESAQASYARVDHDTVNALLGIFGNDGIVVEGQLLEQYGRDKITETHYAGHPEAVVFPTSAEQVRKTVLLAIERSIPLTPRGGGSGLSGGAVPAFGGIVVSFDRMNRVLEIDEQNLTVTVEPGVVTRDLDRILAPHGLFFAGYPMSEEICQIGGNIAENAGGGRAVKYGVTGDYVLGLDVVSGTGEILRLGGKRIKDVTGYNLIGLFVGSEGTLGIVTRITLRLLPRPAFRAAILAFLHDESALRDLTPALLRRTTIRPSSIEMADRICMSLLKSTSKRWTWIPDGAGMILVEYDGASRQAVDGERDAAEAIILDHGGTMLRRSHSDKELDELWLLRKQVPWALMKTSPHQTMEDISVPVSESWALIEATRKLSEKYRVQIANFGHLGDGNIHCTPIKPDGLELDAWYALLDDLLREMYRAAADLGGTISGEHGIGHKRSRFMSEVMGASELAAIAGVKRTFDPHGIMNPGKILPV